MPESIVPVSLATASYLIRIDSGNLQQLADRVASFQPTQVFVLFDQHVQAYVEQAWGNIEESTTGAPRGFPVKTMEVPAGEASKNVRQAERIWEFLAANRADRKSLVVAIGGGVVGDLAGFVAATYARGIRFYQVPTTLLAHVDSSVGGKTGINIATAKNMVGAFWQPVEVLIDTRTLGTLPQREYLSGLAEVIKYGLIMDEAFFEQLERNAAGLVQRDEPLLIDVISHCCRLKAQVVQEDERETTGLRAILNYGHTFAHAFETVFGYGTYLHGEAVAVGMLCAGDLACRLGRVPQEFCRRQEALIRQVGLPTSIRHTDPQPLIEVMRRDKKNVDNRIRFILPNRIGAVSQIDEPIDPEWIAECLTSRMASDLV